MSVQAPDKTKVYDDYDVDDDDGPITFKRNSTTSRQNQSNSEVKKNSSQSSRPISGGASLNGGNSITPKGKVDQSNKSSAVKSPIVSPKASTSALKVSPLKPSTAMSKASTSASKVSSLKPSTTMSKTPTSSGQLKNSSAQAKVSVVKEEKKSSVVTEEKKSSVVKEEKKSSVVKEEKKSSLIKEEKVRLEDSDEDDDKPLSARCKGNVGKPPTKSIVKENLEDSDEKPLRSSFQVKSGAGTSSSKYNDCDDKKPLSSFSRQNGVTPAKRPLDKQKSEISSIKKPKTSDSSPMEKNKQVLIKPEVKEDDDDDHIPISQRIKKSPAKDNKSSSTKPKITKASPSSFKKKSSSFKKPVKNSKNLKKSQYSKSTRVAPGSGDGQKKWTTLIHHGVIFPPPYTPHGVKMLYNGKPVTLTPDQEEVATMYAVMKDTDYVQKKTFRDNFWNDWRELLGKNHVIQKLEACDFTPIYDWCQSEREKKKQLSAEEKKAIKEEKLQQEEKYMWAIVDGVKEKVGNFRVEPPGLFRGRGEHPKSGKWKRRIFPSDVVINIGKDVPVPECPIPGESWKEIRNDDTVTWLAYWNDPINQKEFKYVFLAASSSLKGQSDKEKYEKARKLKGYIHNIRAAYTKDFTSKDVSRRQVAVATYLIDKLALRAGNEKDDDEADTVGCCTLKVENVKTIAPNKLEFNFLGKDSIKYENTVEVELPVYKAIVQFQTRKKGSDDLFDSLDTSKLNTHLKELMPGLTAKVFRTYNASITLDEMLNRDTRDGDLEEKKAVYNAANKEVAIICNHQRTVSKSHEAQMSKLTEKLQELEGLVKDLKVDLERAKKGKPPLKDADGKTKRNLSPEAVEKKIEQTNVKIEKMKRDMHNREDIKTVALGTSKLNYLDPRITVAWCKRHEVPIEKIFNKSCLSKFAWSMDVDPDFRF